MRSIMCAASQLHGRRPPDKDDAPAPAHFSKTCVKQPLKIDKTKVLITTGSLMEVESNTFDLH